MLLEQELIKSLTYYDAWERWKNPTYLDIITHCNIDFSYRGKSASMENINVIDAFANSFDENPYKDLWGKYIKLRKQISHLLYWGTYFEQHTPNYIDENTILRIIDIFLVYCVDKKLLPIKKVPILVWAVSSKNLNFVKKILILINNHRCNYYNDGTLKWVNRNWDNPIDACLKINISLERLQKKKQYLYFKSRSEDINYIFKLTPLQFLEEYNFVTPLILACKLKNIEIAAFLIDIGANWELRDMLQKTAYDYAVENNLLRCGNSSTILANQWYNCFINRIGRFKTIKHKKFWNNLKIANKLKTLDFCIKRTLRKNNKYIPTTITNK